MKTPNNSNTTRRMTRSAAKAGTASNALAIATSTDTVAPSAPSPSPRTNYLTFGTPEGRQWCMAVLAASLTPNPSGLTLSDFPPGQYPHLSRNRAAIVAYARQRNNPKSWEKAKKALNAAIRLGLQNVSDLPPSLLPLLDIPAQGGEAVGALNGFDDAVAAVGGPGQGLVPGQGPVPGQQPGFAAGQVVHSVPPSPAANAAAAPFAGGMLPGQPVAGLVTHDQVNTAFGAVNVMMERFGEGQAKRDANFDAALAKRDADYEKDRKQSQQAFNAVMGRVEGLEGVVKKQGGQISDIQVHQGKTDRRLKKQGGDIYTLQVRHKTLGGKVRNLEEDRRTQNVQIGSLQEGALQHGSRLDDHGREIATLMQFAATSPGGREALDAASKVAAADAAAEAAAKRKPPTTPTTGTAADGFRPSSSSSDSSFLDKKPSSGTARGSSTTAGGRGTAGDDLSDSNLFVQPIRRKGLSQADKDEMDEGIKWLETAGANWGQALRAAGYNVDGGDDSSPSSSSSSSTSSFSDRKPSPSPSPDDARGPSTSAGGRGTASGGGTMVGAFSLLLRLSLN